MHTLYYKEFKQLLGPSVHNLNTICVGLEQIAINNYQKPSTLTISWNTNDPLNDAKRARRYAINLFLVAAVDAIENYINSVISIKDLIPENLVSKIKKVKDNNDGLSEQIKIFFTAVESNPNIYSYWAPAIVLLVKWRNILVHKSKAKANLKVLDKQELEKAYQDIYSRHSKTDINQTINRYLNMEYPTLKDFSTLFTILLHAFKEFDKTISDIITPITIKELIIQNLGNHSFSDLIKDHPNDIKFLKSYSKTQSIDFEEDISYQKLAQKVKIKFGTSNFNKLTADTSKAMKKIKRFCETNSIPYNDEYSLQQVLTL